MSGPRCPLCGAVMSSLPPDASRDRLDQCAGFIPAESFECLTESCNARRIVTTRRCEGPFNPIRLSPGHS